MFSLPIAHLTIDVPIIIYMKIKKLLRLIALILLIALASILPVPITFYRKDNTPKFKIEQLDKKENDIEKDDLKELF